MKPRIDTVYIYQHKSRSIMASKFTKINQRAQKDFRFLRGNTPDVAEEAYRYALTVTINDIDRTLLMVSLEKNKRKINKFFALATKQIQEDPELLQKFALANQKPIETRLTYGH